MRVIPLHMRYDAVDGKGSKKNQFVWVLTPLACLNNGSGQQEMQGKARSLAVCDAGWHLGNWAWARVAIDMQPDDPLRTWVETGCVARLSRQLAELRP